MKQEEKADDLVLQFQQHCEIHGSKPGEAAYDSAVLRSHAKACAIIAVKEIIPCTWKESTYKKNGYTYVDPITTTEYWEQVLKVLGEM